MEPAGELGIVIDACSERVQPVLGHTLWSARGRGVLDRAELRAHQLFEPAGDRVRKDVRR